MRSQTLSVINLLTERNDMQLFYLRHNDGRIMPDIIGKHGHTWSEPTNHGIPRLFTSERSATMSLRVWTGGTRHRDEKNDFNSVCISKVPSRNMQDWEVRPVQLG